MKILVINQPLNNRGDEAAHKGFIRSIVSEVENVEIRVLFFNVNQDSINQFSVQSDHVEYVNEKNTLPIVWGYLIRLCQYIGLLDFCYLHPNFKTILKHYQWADVVVCAPGGICMGGFQNWSHLFYLQLAKYVHKPLAYYGRSFGPFPETTWKNRRFKAISMQMLRYFTYLSIRDNKTEQLAKKLEIPYIHTVDSAFLNLPKVEIPLPIKEKIGNGDYFVFVPNLLIWHYAYKAKITKNELLKFYADLIDKIFYLYPNSKAVLLPQTFNYGTEEGDDINFFKEFETYKKDNRIVVIDDIYSSDIQQTIIAYSQLVVGARYHSVVFSLNNAVPFIALSYEHKISGLLETLDKVDCMVDIQNFILTKNGRIQILKEFQDKLQCLHSDVEAKEKAKRASVLAFDKFNVWLRTCQN